MVDVVVEDKKLPKYASCVVVKFRLTSSYEKYDSANAHLASSITAHLAIFSQHQNLNFKQNLGLLPGFCDRV